MKSLAELLKSYRFNPASPEFLSGPGEILKFVGNQLVMVKLTKTEEDWKTESTGVIVEAIGDYDPITGTYVIAYKEEGSDETLTERIIPGGFSFNNPEKDGWMHRFLPYSLHFKIGEGETYQRRVEELYQGRETLGMDSIEALKNLGKGAMEQFHNIICAVDTKDGMCHFRIYGVSGINKLPGDKDVYSFLVKDKSGNAFPVRYTEGEDHGTMKIQGTIIGDVKIINLETSHGEYEFPRDDKEA